MTNQRVVVVTGASAGVGRATAVAFADQGDAVALIARGRAGLEAARRDVEAAGGTALAIPADVADPEAMERAADQIERELGPIDIWVNNAMSSVFAPFADVRPEEFRRVTEVTYLGTVYGTMAALRGMKPRDQGHIIQVGSALAYRSIPLQSAYCGAKHAIIGFTDSLRSELLHDGSSVKVTAVHLPALNTPQFQWVRVHLPHTGQPVPPIYQPEVAAQAIVWATRQHRREVWVGKSTYAAVLGNRIAPGLLDHHLARMGYGAQQREGEIMPDRPDNLWQPLDDDRDFGAHGLFDDSAREHSWALWATQHRRGLATALGGTALFSAAGALLSSRRWRDRFGGRGTR